MDSAVARVLSRSKLHLASPGDSSLTNLYARPSNAVSHLAEAVVSRGRNKVSANSKIYGGVANFQISSSDIVDDVMLVAKITPVAATMIPRVGWLFDAIQSYEVIFSNSVISNLQVDGDIAKQYMLLCCRDSEAREKMLEAAGDLVPTGGAAWACVPIHMLIYSAIGQEGNFPLDFSTLNGPVQINIKLKPAINWIEGSAVGIGNSVSFDDLYITHTSTQLTDQAFSVRSAMSNDPSLVYSTPSMYLNDVPYSITSTAGTAYVMNINSAPAGHLVGIILYPQADVWVSSTAVLDKYYVPADLSQISLKYGGTELFRADSANEIKQFYRLSFGGDDLSYQVRCGTAAQVAAPLYTAIATRALLSNVWFIPLSKMARRTLEHEIENCPSYGGASLQLSFNIVPDAGLRELVNATPFQKTASVRIAQTTAYTFKVGFLVNSLLEVSEGVTDLVL